MITDKLPTPLDCSKSSRSPWTLALLAAGVVTAGSIANAEESSNQVLTALSATTLSGYVETSAIWKPGTGAGALPGRSFDGADKVDGFNLHAVRLTLEKPLDEGEWSAGYKTDLVFGPDANYFGGAILNGGGFSNGDDFAIKQAYVALRAPVGNGLDLKMGVWDTCIGYEVFDSPANPNFSRSFGYGIEPVTHTGLLASYQALEGLTIMAGVAETWFGAINERPSDGGAVAESQKTYMALFSYVLPESAGALSGTAIYAGVVDGLYGASAGPNSKDTTSYYVGTTIATPLEGFSFGGAFDYREDGSNAVTVGDNWAWAGAVYASYQATEKLKLSARGDYITGSSGTIGLATVEGDSVKIGAATLTAEYTLWASVLTRAEVRWDRDLGSERPYGIADQNAVTVAANVIYKF